MIQSSESMHSGFGALLKRNSNNEKNQNNLGRDGSSRLAVSCPGSFSSDAMRWLSVALTLGVFVGTWAATQRIHGTKVDLAPFFQRHHVVCRLCVLFSMRFSAVSLRSLDAAQLFVFVPQRQSTSNVAHAF